MPRRSPEFDPPQAATPLDLNAVPQPPEGSAERDAAVRGRYLAAEIGACIICHSPRDLASPTVLDYTTFFTGNEVFDVGLPVMSRAGNITSDTETGIGDYTVDVKLFADGNLIAQTNSAFEIADRKSTRLNSSHSLTSRMPSSA